MPALTWITQHKLWTLGIGFVTLVTLIVAVAAGFWYFVLRTPRTQVNLAQALRQYRLDQKTGGARNAGLPSSGVYRYRTSGSEHLSIGDISRSFPAASNMIVTDGAGCATMKWDPLEQHMEGLVECSNENGTLGIKAVVSYEQIAGTQTTSVIDCPAGTYFVPPHPSIGERWRTTCHSPGETVVFSGQVLGKSFVNVGGGAVPALRTRLTLSFSGSQSGTNPNTYWISLQNGLILRQLETVDVSEATGPLGAVHYTERMAIALDSVVPTR
jgi:hypothetical protein